MEKDCTLGIEKHYVRGSTTVEDYTLETAIVEDCTLEAATVEDYLLEETTVHHHCSLVRKPESEGKKRRRALRNKRNAPPVLPAMEKVVAQSEKVSMPLAQSEEVA